MQRRGGLLGRRWRRRRERQTGKVTRRGSGVNQAFPHDATSYLRGAQPLPPHGAPTYHLADRHHHIHLVCRDCTQVIEADVSVAAEFTAKLSRTFGFETDMKHFAIFGRCKDCSLKSSTTES